MPRRDLLDLNRESGSRPEAQYARNRTTERESLRYPVGLDYYKPSYKMLNYTTWKTDVSGIAEYYETLGGMSGKFLKNLKKTQDSVNLAETYNSINEELRHKAREFKNNSESGEGFLQYMSSEHAKLSEKYLSGVFDPEYSGTLKTMLLKSKADWENQAFEEEQSMRTAYTLRKAENAINDICVGMVTNPGNFESGMLAVENALEGYRNVAGEQAYAKVADESIRNFTYCYGLGIIQKNPWNAKALMQDDKIKILHPNQVQHLMATAESEIHKREVEARRRESALEQSRVIDQQIAHIQLEKRMFQNGAESVTENDMDNAGLSPEGKKALMERQAEIHGEQKKQEQVDIAMKNSVEKNIPLGAFSKADQLRYLVQVANAKGINTLKDYVEIGKKLGVTVQDKRTSDTLYSTLLGEEDNVELVKKNLADWAYTNATGSPLIAKPTKEERFVLNRMLKALNTEGTNILQVRNTAKEQIKKLNNDPSYKSEQKERAKEFIKGSEFTKGKEKIWDSISEEMHKKWSWLATKDLEKIDNRQYEESENFFNRYFTEEVKSLVATGYTEQEAMDFAAGEFVDHFGKTALVPNRIMYMPPEVKYRGTSKPKDLQKKFLKVAVGIDKEYEDKNIKPEGFTIRRVPTKGDTVFAFDNGAGVKGQARLNLEFDQEKDAYDLFLIRKDGTRMYLPRADGHLITVDFDKIELTEEDIKNEKASTGPTTQTNNGKSKAEELKELDEIDKAIAKKQAELLAKKNGK